MEGEREGKGRTAVAPTKKARRPSRRLPPSLSLLLPLPIRQSAGVASVQCGVWVRRSYTSFNSEPKSYLYLGRPLHCTGRPICSWTCVGLTLIWVLHHLSHPLLPKSYLPKQNRADSGTHKLPVNPTQSTSRWDTLYTASLPLSIYVVRGGM